MGVPPVARHTRCGREIVSIRVAVRYRVFATAPGFRFVARDARNHGIAAHSSPVTAA